MARSATARKSKPHAGAMPTELGLASEEADRFRDERNPTAAGRPGVSCGASGAAETEADKARATFQIYEAHAPHFGISVLTGRGVPRAVFFRPGRGLGGKQSDSTFIAARRG
jgi:hypothetical protein